MRHRRGVRWSCEKTSHTADITLQFVKELIWKQHELNDIINLFESKHSLFILSFSYFPLQLKARKLAAGWRARWVDVWMLCVECVIWSRVSRWNGNVARVRLTESSPSLYQWLLGMPISMANTLSTHFSIHFAVSFSFSLARAFHVQTRNGGVKYCKSPRDNIKCLMTAHFSTAARQSSWRNSSTTWWYYFKSPTELFTFFSLLFIVVVDCWQSRADNTQHHPSRAQATSLSLHRMNEIINLKFLMSPKPILSHRCRKMRHEKR